jgi:hypothetical protein
MPKSDRPVAGTARRIVFAVAAAALVVAWSAVAEAQVLTTTTRAVGGVSINAEGMLTHLDVAAAGEFDKLRLEAVPDALRPASELRKVSLKGLHAVIERHLREGTPLPEDVLCLGGLQEIRYVLVYPEQQDIVLAGFGEGWKLDKRGNIVGMTTGRPVILLDDLLTALRALGGNVRGPMSCSIDPTPEGIQRVSALARKLRDIGNPDTTASAVEEHLGPQKITVAGVPETSHFARVMVAADYRMKRISMGLERAPIAGLPAFLEFVRASGRGMSNMLPRWWLEPDYPSLVRDEQGFSWEIRGGSVKAVAEVDFFDAQGKQHPSGKADPASQRWADLMTRRYAELALAEPVFGQLRNCMDVAVAAALIAKENLLAKAGVTLPQLTQSDGAPTVKLDAPRQVASKATLVKKGRSWMIAAGGVSINPWSIVEKTVTQRDVATVRTKAAARTPATWWWD